MLDAGTLGADLAAMVKAQFGPVLARIEERMGALEKRIEAIPAPKDGKDADPASVAALVADSVRSDLEAIRASIPKAIEPVMPDVEGMVKEAVAKAIADIPAPEAGRPGVGVAGALIDREGELVLTLSNGETKALGKVVGKDADPVQLPDIPAMVKAAVAEIPSPKDGVDGVGFDDMSIEHDGERSITLRFVRGEKVVEKTIAVPVMLDRGVYRTGQAYEKGDAVTFGGSVWVAQAETTERPGTGPGWRLAVKAGRNGSDGVVKAAREEKPLQLRGGRNAD